MFEPSIGEKIGRALSAAIVAIVLFECLGAFADSRETIDSPDTPPALHIIRVKGTGYKGTSNSALSKDGERRFANLNCTACHGIHNVGGSIGPILDGVGGRRSAEYMEAKLADSDEAKKRFTELTLPGSTEMFEHRRISKEAAHAIVAYLLTIPDPADGYVVEGHTRLPAEAQEVNKSFHAEKATADSREGAKLYNEFGCVACHSIADIGGWLGPSLDGVGGRRSREFMTAHITDSQLQSRKEAAKGFEVVSKMPRIKATPEQIRKIVVYLETLPNQTK